MSPPGPVGVRTIALALGLAGILGCAPAPRIEMVDVTPVWPLRTDDDFAARGFILASTVAQHGEVFPRDFFDSVPALTRSDEPDAIYASLVLVGARLDPCFKEGFDDPPCEASIRIVLQPVLPSPLPVGAGPSSPAPAFEARDASIHVFYGARDAQEVLDAIRAMATARVERGFDGAGPLGVSALLESDEGRARVREILLPLIGRDRLIRVTSMESHSDATAWIFSGFAVTEIGTFKNPDEVFAQHVISNGTIGAIDVIVDPAAGPDNFNVLLEDDVAAAATLADRQAAFDAAARIENPELNNSGTQDCVSCHLASVVREEALVREPLEPSPDAYASTTRDLGTPSNFQNQRLIHNLGYRFTELGLSPRLINESALVADQADAALHP